MGVSGQVHPAVNTAASYILAVLEHCYGSSSSLGDGRAVSVLDNVRRIACIVIKLWPEATNRLASKYKINSMVYGTRRFNATFTRALQ